MNGQTSILRLWLKITAWKKHLILSKQLWQKLPKSNSNIEFPNQLGTVIRSATGGSKKPPFLLINFAVFRRSSRNNFLEIERHGKVAIAFDKANLIVPPHLDTNKHFPQMVARFNEIKIRFDLLQPRVKKEIYRGHLVDAIGNYHNWTLLPLVKLLGMIYRPHRYDFELKYFTRDFPPEIVDRVAPLFCIANLEDLAAKQQIAEDFFAETLPLAEAKFYSKNALTLPQ